MSKNKRWLKSTAYRRMRNYLRSYRRFSRLSAKRQARLHRKGRGQPPELYVGVYTHGVRFSYCVLPQPEPGLPTKQDLGL